MMTKASEVQLKILNIKLLHLNPSTSEQKKQTKFQHKHSRSSKCENQKTNNLNRFLRIKYREQLSLYQGKPNYKINFKGEPQILLQDETKSRKPLRTLSISSTVQKGSDPSTTILTTSASSFIPSQKETSDLQNFF